MPSLLFAENLVLLASSDQDLKNAQEWFAAECEVVVMRVSLSEAMVLCQKTVDCSNKQEAWSKLVTLLC